jgi:hypothetical protein
MYWGVIISHSATVAGGADDAGTAWAADDLDESMDTLLANGRKLADYRAEIAARAIQKSLAAR